MIWLALAACGDPTGSPVAETPDAQPAPEQAPPPVAPRRARSGPFVWEDVEPSELKMRATQAVEVTLLAKPTASVEGGICHWVADAPIAVTGSVRLVRRPVALPWGARDLPAETTDDYASTRLLRLSAPPVPTPQLSLPPAAMLDWVGTRGDGRCMYRVGLQRVEERLVATTCFDDVVDAPVAERWLEVSCEAASGWLRVDERQDVEVSVAGAP